MSDSGKLLLSPSLIAGMLLVSTEQGIDGQGTPAITTVEAAHDLGQHSEGLEPSPSMFSKRIFGCQAIFLWQQGKNNVICPKTQNYASPLKMNFKQQ